MKKCFFEIISVFVILSFLSSCATMPLGTGNAAPENTAEREILLQAITTGAILGGTFGAGLGALLDENNRVRGGAIGGAVGTFLGGIIGNEVGKKQIYNYRNVQLKNEQLAKLLNSARAYNQKVANYNANLRSQIAGLNRSRPEHKKIALRKQKEAERYRAQVEAAINERRKLSKTLVPAQKAKYQRTLRELERKKQELAATISELERISGPAIVG